MPHRLSTTHDMDGGGLVVASVSGSRPVKPLLLISILSTSLTDSIIKICDYVNHSIMDTDVWHRRDQRPLLAVFIASTRKAIKRREPTGASKEQLGIFFSNETPV